MFRSTLSVLFAGISVVAFGFPAGAKPSRPAGRTRALVTSEAADEWPEGVKVALPKDPVERRRKIRELQREYGRVLRTVGSRMRTRPDFGFEHTSVKSVLEYLAEVGRFSIVFDDALQKQGIDLEARPVTLKASGITYEKAIELILPKGAGYRVGPGYVLITTLEKSWLPLQTGSYSIRLHLAEVPNFTDAPRFEAGDVIRSAAEAATGAGGGGVDLFGQAGPDEADKKGRATPERIIDLVKRFVAHANDRRIAPWDDAGGPATIQYLNGHLIVSQTAAGHRAVRRLLWMLE